MENLDFVHVTLEDGLAILEIANPPVNVLTTAVFDDLSKVLDRLEGSEDVRALIITGEGSKAFIAGADIKRFPSLGVEEGKKLAEDGCLVFERIEKLRFPVIAAVNGVALGGGCELALACDIRIASENAKFGFPEVSLGIIPGYGGTQRLPRLVGTGKAKEMIFSGQAVRAEEAYRTGLVDQLTAQGEVLQVAKELAQKIMANGPLAVSAAKKVIHEGMNMTLEAGVKLESESFGSLFATEDKNEGTTAFLEKRPAQFKGK